MRLSEGFDLAALEPNEPGALTLNQLNTSDAERAQEFYSGVLGWRFEPVEGGDMPYGRILVAADPQGAVFALFEGEFDE